MSFGIKEYQHRFYTAPKIRIRHNQNVTSPEINRQRYQSVGTTNPLDHINQNTMKQSYLRMVNNSRIYTKDQVGYQGLKFQKDVVNRYSQNDYQKNAQILQKFKKQAEQIKRNKKYRHVKTESSYLQRQKLMIDRQNGYHQLESLPNKSISLLPITSHNPEKAFLDINKTPNIKSTKTQVSRMLPQLKMSKYLPQHNSRMKSIVMEEDELYSQNQFLDQEGTPVISRVRDVGINAHIQTADDENISHRRLSEKYERLEENLSRKKSQSLKLQMLKSKNKQLKKKYDQLKKQMIRKSRQLLNDRKQSEQKQHSNGEQQFEQKMENLSEMIHSLCDKLKQNNSKLIERVNKKVLAEESSEELKYHSLGKKQSETNDKQQQTQINFLKTARENQQNQMPKPIVNTDKYTVELEKLDSYRKIKPKVVYMFNKNPKNFKIDSLTLLKNRLKQQQLNRKFLYNNTLV